MSEEKGPPTGSRWVRVDGAVRFIDAPNSRLGLEVDLSRLPWDLFEALGKRVSVLIPADGEEMGGSPGAEDPLTRALRYVEHAAARSREFARQETGGDPELGVAYETWSWLRDYLLEALAAGNGRGGNEARPLRDEAKAPGGEEPEEMPFDQAFGFDEGYQMGRKVGRALGAHARRPAG